MDDDQHNTIDPDSLSYVERKSWDKQEKFLTGFSEIGSISAGLKVAKIGRRTQEYWRSKNYLDFTLRFTHAHKNYCDSLENKMQELIMGLKPGQNALVLVVRANAEMPEKYRPGTIVGDDTAKEFLEELQRVKRESMRGREEREKTSPVPAQELRADSEALKEAEKLISTPDTTD